MVQKVHKLKSTKKKKQQTEYSEKKYLAIDPGKSGGVAIIDDDKVTAYKCGQKVSEIYREVQIVFISSFGWSKLEESSTNNQFNKATT